MAQASGNDMLAYLLAATANSKGHAKTGIRDRRATNIALLLSAVLSAVASAGVLSDFLSKTVVGVISLAATIATLVAIACLQTLKPEQHLRAKSEYDVVISALNSFVRPKTGENDEYSKRFEECRADFNRAVANANKDGVPLSPGQVKKYQADAQKDILETRQMTADLKSKLEAVNSEG